VAHRDAESAARWGRCLLAVQLPPPAPPPPKKVLRPESPDAARLDGPAGGFGQELCNRGILGARGADGGGQPPPAGHPGPPAGAILGLRGPAATSWQRPRLALEAKRNRHQTLRVPQFALLFCAHRRYFTSVVPIDLALERMCIRLGDDPGPGRSPPVSVFSEVRQNVLSCFLFLFSVPVFSRKMRPLALVTSVADGA
jgi:hypothetical protein